MKPKLVFIFKALVLFAVYFFTARAGLSLGPVSKFATLVWPPTGIALSALLLGGTELWPAIFLAAALVNYVTGAPPLTAIAIGAGNVLEPLLGVYLLKRAGFRRRLDRFQSVVAFVGLAVFASTLASATVGVSALYLGHLVEGSHFGETWRAWWLGDVMGNLVVTPVLLVWYRNLGFTPNLRKTAETVAIFALTGFGSLAVLTDWKIGGNSLLLRPYLLFPILMLASLRLTQRGVVIAHLIVATITIGATATGHGPFVDPSLSEGLLYAQIFLGILFITQLLLTGIVTERRHEREVIADSNAQLRQERELRERFVATLSHDLRSPLTAALTGAELLRRVQDSPEANHRIADRIASSIQRADRMIQDLLDAHSVRAGQKLFLQLARADLTKLAHESIDELAVIHGDRFVLKAPGMLEGNWDAKYLRRMLDNLAGNAIKYGAPGAPVTIRLEQHADRVSVAVHNEGAPLTVKELKTIFEPFRRADNAKQGQQKGWGLGLTLVRGIAEAHGGTISVRSSPESGTTFRAEFPREANLN